MFFLHIVQTCGFVLELWVWEFESLDPFGADWERGVVYLCRKPLCFLLLILEYLLLQSLKPRNSARHLKPLFFVMVILVSTSTSKNIEHFWIECCVLYNLPFSMSYNFLEILLSFIETSLECEELVVGVPETFVWKLLKFPSLTFLKASLVGWVIGMGSVDSLLLSSLRHWHLDSLHIWS